MRFLEISIIDKVVNIFDSENNIMECIQMIML